MDYTIQELKALDKAPGQQIVVGAICVVLTTLLVTWYARKSGLARQKFRLPPGPKGWPILGSLPLLKGARHQALYKLSTEYGPLMFMHLGTMPTLVVSNAKMAKEVYKTNDRFMASRPDFAVSTMLFYNRQDLGFAPYGSLWRKARKICTLELFTASRITQFQSKRTREIDRMVQSVLEEGQRGNTINTNIFFAKMAMNTITQMMWNKSHRTYYNSPTTDEEDDVFADLFKEISLIMGVNNIGDFIPILNWLSMNLQGLNKRATIAHQKLDDFIEKIIEEHKQQRSLSGVAAENTSSDADDLVDVFLNQTMRSEADHDQPLSEYSIRGILADLIVAGGDSTSNTLEWALAELIKNPHVMRRLRDELSSVVGPDRLVSEDDVPKLSYLNAVVKETLRLHTPPALALPHFSIADCEIDGFHIPAESLVFINLWAIHRDPEMWERPFEFDPERFLDQGASAAVDWKGLDFQLVPFGAGRRMCPGMNLASPIVHLALAQLVHCVEWSLPGEQKPEDLDMTEANSFQVSKESRLILAAKPRLSSEVWVSDPP